jgi:hypothetical protein
MVHGRGLEETCLPCSKTFSGLFGTPRSDAVESRLFLSPAFWFGMQVGRFDSSNRIDQRCEKHVSHRPILELGRFVERNEW